MSEALHTNAPPRRNARLPDEMLEPPKHPDDLKPAEVLSSIRIALQLRNAVDQRRRVDLAAMAWMRACGMERDVARETWHKACSKDGEVTGVPTHALVMLAPQLEHRARLARVEAEIKRNAVKQAPKLPGWTFVNEVKGFGAATFVQIVGEAGGLDGYAGPIASAKGKLWKRLGLAVMDGRRQGNPGPGATAADWTRHGYVPRRRSLCYVLATCILKAGGTYAELYREKRAEYAAANDSGLFATTAARQLAELSKKKAADDADAAESSALRKKWADGKLSDKQLHDRAMRWMTKRLIRDLLAAWRADRRAAGCVTTAISDDGFSVRASGQLVN